MGTGGSSSLWSPNLLFTVFHWDNTILGSSKSRQDFKPLILLAKDVEKVSETTNKTSQEVMKLYDSFKTLFPKGSLYKR